MKISSIRNALLLALAVFAPVGGYYAAKNFEEPYPWLMMPGFRGDMRNDQGQFAVANLYIAATFQDGQEKQMSFEDFMAPMHDVKAGSVYHKILRPDPRNTDSFDDIMGTPETSRFYYVKRYAIPGHVARRHNSRPAQPHPETVQWLAKRAEEKFGCGAPIRIVLSRTEKALNERGKLVEGLSKTTKHLEVILE